MKSGDVVRDRYRIEERIGKGVQGETWRAGDVSANRKVVLKVFDFTGSEGWGGFERFENEARVLRSIDHPRVPDYIDQFEYEDARRLVYILVQEYIDGLTIEQRVVDGKRETVAEIQRIAAELIDIIRYMQSVSPAIIHRDINPKNVILDRSGTVYLVDFGGVQDLLPTSGSTVIGRPGFVPIEQFSGRSTPRSDLYGCAATILFLLTHRNPTELPVQNLKIDIAESCPGISEELGLVLGSWLEPDEQKRDLSVDEAIGVLRGDISVSQLVTSTTTSFQAHPDSGSAVYSGDPGELTAVPEGSRIAHRIASDGSHTVSISAAGFRGKGIILLPFVIFWNGFVGFWTFMSVSMGAPIAFTLFSLPFWAVGIGMFVKAVRAIFERVELHVDNPDSSAGRFRITRAFGRMKKVIDVPVTEVGSVRLDNSVSRNGRIAPACVFEAGVKRVRIGEHLSDREKGWLLTFVKHHAKGRI